MRFSTELTKEIVLLDKPDTVIIATGGVPSVPLIRGIDKPHVFFAEDVLLGHVITGHNIVVAGGGDVGSETAAHLAMQSKNVTIVEMLSDIMPEGSMTKLRLKALLDEFEVGIHVNSKVQEIADGHVVVEKGGKRFAIEADTVVLALGYKPLNQLADSIKEICSDVRIVGGAVKTSNALAATREGFDAGMTI